MSDDKKELQKYESLLEKLAKEIFIGEGKTHWHLKDCKILWVVKKTLSQSCHVGKVPALWHEETGFDIVIKVHLGTLKAREDDGKINAFVDHILSHIELLETDAYAIASPDIQEFTGVLSRHGLWRPQVSHLQQLQFDFEGEVKK